MPNYCQPERITIIRQSVDYPDYYLARLGDETLLIVSRITDGEDLDYLTHHHDADGGAWFVMQDDGYDLAGDFETHCDNLAEESHYLAAEAEAEFAAEFAMSYVCGGLGGA